VTAPADFLTHFQDKEKESNKKVIDSLLERSQCNDFSGQCKRWYRGKRVVTRTSGWNGQMRVCLCVCVCVCVRSDGECGRANKSS